MKTKLIEIFLPWLALAGAKRAERMWMQHAWDQESLAIENAENCALLRRESVSKLITEIFALKTENKVLRLANPSVANALDAATVNINRKYAVDEGRLSEAETFTQPRYYAGRSSLQTEIPSNGVATTETVQLDSPHQKPNQS